MLAAGQSGKGLFVMEKGRRGDVNEVNGFVSEQFVQAAVGGDIRHVEFHRIVAADVAVHVRKIAVQIAAAGIAQRADFNAVHRLVCAQMRHGHEAGSHDSYPNVVHDDFLRGQRRRPFWKSNRHTIQMASQTMLPDILDWPSMRSVNTIGTSPMRSPCRQILWVSSI